MGEAEAHALAQVVRSGSIAQGARVAAFEREVARLVGVRGAVACSSGTAALHLALLALNIGDGDEVLLPTYACSALLHAVRAVRAAPRLVDSDPESFNIDPAAARKARSARAKALIVVHSFGLPADLDELKALGLPVIEAAAHALGAFYRGEPVGSIGEASVFSFYATKVITTGEGGMLLSNDERILAMARDLRAYDQKDADRPRFNYKLTDLQAALGLAQLERLPEFLKRREAIASFYAEQLHALNLKPPAAPQDRARIYYRYVVKGPWDADHYLARLQTCGVEARQPVFRPLHWYLGLGGFPGAEEAWEKAVSLPLYPSLTDAEIERVVAAALESFR
ncbi:MAG: DegT/DnrJ/EryC1/StrS family aminotransferase [Candidatus Rokubacteria bacterium]|nr:DegT/DnrJ/EryC1/StrS family aminotransferase [Candidatus Rokubacteria bacterium]